MSVTDDIVFRVRSYITTLNIGNERSKLQLEGRHRKFWFIGKTRVKVGDDVEVYYVLLRDKYNNNYEERAYKIAWITKIVKLKTR